MITENRGFCQLHVIGYLIGIPNGVAVMIAVRLIVRVRSGNNYEYDNDIITRGTERAVDRTRDFR